MNVFFSFQGFDSLKNLKQKKQNLLIKNFKYLNKLQKVGALTLETVTRLYGAFVQTDIQGNIHGIQHGWAWLARFLNKTTTHNRPTTTALNTFLRTAGFGLHQWYTSQFLKDVNVVREVYKHYFHSSSLMPK